MARRYHWLSERVQDFVDEPHAAIEGEPAGAIVNLTDHRAARARALQVELIAQGPERTLEQMRQVGALAIASARPPVAAEAEAMGTLPHLQLPARHDVRAGDVIMRRLHGSLAAAERAAPRDFEQLLLVPGIGPRALCALAMVAEVVHGAPSRFSDPARFSLAHGGKDGHPFPVPLDVYDRTLTVYRHAIEQAKLGRDDKLSALRKLAHEAQRLEAAARGPSFDEFVAAERVASPRYGGRSVGGPQRATRATGSRVGATVNDQLTLPGLGGAAPYRRVAR
jgi:hypothetical protein